MATETADRRASHQRSVKVTALACLAGIAAGVVAQRVTAGPGDSLGVAVAAGAFFVALGAMRVIGIDVDEFSTKDHLYVAFMTISLWFVTWTVLLIEGATI